MSHPLEGTWRCLILTSTASSPSSPGNPTSPPSGDGIFRLEEIDATGKITKGFHDLELTPPQSVSVTGQMTPSGLGFTIVMEHPEFNSTTRKVRYEGLLALDSPIGHRLVIVGFKKTTTIVPPKRAAKSTKSSESQAANLVQDDGTVVITRP